MAKIDFRRVSKHHRPAMARIFQELDDPKFSPGVRRMGAALAFAAICGGTMSVDGFLADATEREISTLRKIFREAAGRMARGGENPVSAVLGDLSDVLAERLGTFPVEVR